MRKPSLFIAIILALQISTVSGFAQPQSLMDSLKKKLTTIPPDTNKVLLLNELAKIYTDRDSALALGYSRDAVRLSEQLNYKRGEALSLLRMGNTYYYVQQFKPAITYLTAGIEKAVEAGDRELQANALHDIGNSYTGMGAYDIGLEYLLKARSLFEKAGDSMGLAATSLNIGIVYGSTKDFGVCIRYLTESYEIAQRKKKEYALSQIEVNLGTAWMEQEAFGKALVYFQSYLKRAEQLQLPQDIGFAKASLAYALAKLNKFDSVKRLSVAAIKIAEETESKNLESLAKNALALYYSHANKMDSAVQLLKPLVDTLRVKTMFPEAVTTYKNLIAIYKKNNQFNQALAIAESLALLEDSIFNINKQKNIDALKIKFETEKQLEQIQALKAQSRLKSRINYAVMALLLIGVAFILLLLSRIRTGKKLLLQKENTRREEALRRQAELELKNRELATAALYLENKNEVLRKLKDQLQTIQPPAPVKELEKMIHNSISFDEEWKKFKLHFEQVHPQFFEKLNNNFPGLTQNDLKECAYIKMKLSTKEVANLLGISPESVKIRRHRIKKKIELLPDQNLSDFIGSL